MLPSIARTKSTKSVGILNASTPKNDIPGSFTSAMGSGMTMGDTEYNGGHDDNTDMNIIMTPHGLPETQQFQFEPNTFDFIQQVQTDYNRAALFQQLNIAEGPFGESFEFSDFITDCF
ncbi:putative mating-type HMG box protein partial [Aspergillus clavatus NRRL 1]|uniref:Mating-type HMG box protein partial, putative n=1 Tax=Aspergillus clavatus (strain ATCC 1007 / CBS 513.65 / DSM 816 / NCTC 3887 / NRRL 1 / QM 1276 / 107) TaxID=344612 RepID=A1CJ85_ASPCL|nr:mating-type HMG box protein partial, putative [Aspergillus clavatus NRRL 1]EAW09209.1 mating-type HMG box protein partial, putative [Aspergillus clavatus NRRL 1]